MKNEVKTIIIKDKVAVEDANKKNEALAQIKQAMDLAKKGIFLF